MNKFLKLLSVLVIICALGWGISSIAEDDIASAHNNFSVVGIISDISDENISVEQAQGSDRSNKTSYTLNIKNLEKIETNKYQVLNLSDIKVGDKIIAQGLTNGSTFFIKRIISFADVVVKDDVFVTTTENIVSTSSDSNFQSGASDNVMASTSDNNGDISTSIIDQATSTTTPTSTDTVDTSTSSVSTSTEVVDVNATSTETSTTTDSIVDKVVDVVQEVIETVKETISDIVNNNDQASTTSDSI